MSTSPRREFLSWVTQGLGGAAMASLMLRDGTLRAASIPGEARDLPPHHAPKAKRAIHICCCGAMSHLDTFDYKPELVRLHGKSLKTDERPDVFFGQVGLLRAPDWTFRQYGECGRWVSDLFPKLGEMVDEMTFIHSMYAETSNHTPAIFQENTGFRLNGFPVLGSWLSYGLGAETDSLPAFVAIPDAREFPAGGSINWTNGFLPARHQGVVLRARGNPIDDLFAAREIAPSDERAARELMQAMNARHLEAHQGADPLAARMQAYEMAARMQLAVPEVAELNAETAETQSLYGLERKETSDFGRACLMARRLLERGVRFVQLFSGGTFGSPRRNWDGHEDMKENHGQEAARIDQPVAALLADLRRRGLLDDTLVVCTTEFGRTPFTQSAADVVGKGRDHNQHAFTVWLAGAGLKPGYAHGATDDVGYRAVENRVHWHDFHATVLHLLGIDHERLTYYHNGIQRRLTNVHGEVMREILA
jgi:hypothetical protein